MNKPLTPFEMRIAERRQRWEAERIAKILELVLKGEMTREEAKERL